MRGGVNTTNNQFVAVVGARRATRARVGARVHCLEEARLRAGMSSGGLVAWCCDYPWYAAAAVFLVANLLLLVDVGQDIPLLFPLRWLFSGPHRSTPEYARLKSKYLVRR